jgi:hypothetical protein
MILSLSVPRGYPLLSPALPQQLPAWDPAFAGMSGA